MVAATERHAVHAEERHLAAVQEAKRPPVRPHATPVLLRVLIATFVVAIFPVLLVWWLRLSGTLRSPLGSMGAGVALSLLLANLGAAYWKRRPASRDMLFNELLLWGYLYRRLRERRLASAKSMLGRLSAAPGAASGAEERARVLERLARMLDARDPLTYGHSRRVARHAWMLAQRMGCSSEEVARIRTAAAIHDVGKINTPLEILRKPSRLSDAEFAVIKRHPVDGAQIAAALRDKRLCAIIRHHHERLDGSGYPDGLAGEEIPIGARIISVADTFDAITSVRPYRSSRSHQQALAILRAEAGERLDPDAVRAFCAHYSGRAPLTAWATLTSLPEGILARVAGALFGAGAPAKLAALAVTLGGVSAATGALALVVPARAHRPVAAARASAAAERLAASLAPQALPGQGQSGALLEAPLGGSLHARIASVRAVPIRAGAGAPPARPIARSIAEPSGASSAAGGNAPAAVLAAGAASGEPLAGQGAQVRRWDATGEGRSAGSSKGAGHGRPEEAGSKSHRGSQVQSTASSGGGSQGSARGSHAESEAGQRSAGGQPQPTSAATNGSEAGAHRSSEGAPSASGSEASVPTEPTAASGAGSQAHDTAEAPASSANASNGASAPQQGASGRAKP